MANRRKSDEEGKKKKSLKSWKDVPKVILSTFKFNPNVQYEIYMQKFVEDFEEKWNNDCPSLCNGLEGFSSIARLATGAFGKVILVQENETNNFYACKTFKKHSVVKNKFVQNIHREKKILNAISFPFVIYLKFSRKSYDKLFLGTPFLIGGDLLRHLRASRKLMEKEALFYGAQIFLALEYLHTLNIIHRDIKPENICFRKNGYIALADLGFAKKVVGRTTTICGTAEYMAPEIIKSIPYNTSVDWWSFGILIYEMVAGSTPFAEHKQNLDQMYNRICAGFYTMPTQISSNLRQLIENLLQINTMKRIGNWGNGIKDIKEHEWFKDIDWYSMLNETAEAPHKPLVNGDGDLSYFHGTTGEITPSIESSSNQYEDEFINF